MSGCIHSGSSATMQLRTGAQTPDMGSVSCTRARAALCRVCDEIGMRKKNGDTYTDSLYIILRL